VTYIDTLMEKIKTGSLDTTTVPVWKAERVVIEAAKALLVDDRPLQDRVDRLTDATHALLVVESEAG
jgi:hypothetical protein